MGGGPSTAPDRSASHPTAPGNPAPAAPLTDTRGVPAKAYTRWGLPKPLAPVPERPDRTPVLKPSGPPVVLDRVKTNDKVVFLTYDDGAEKDPQFVKMVAELKLPVSMFLTDSVAGSDYDHFKKLRDAGGGTIQNHTTGHANLRTLSYEGQRRQICGQQDRLEAHFGTRPTLFRPPYGNYNSDTVRAAGSCGVKALVLWRESMQIHNMRYAEGDRLKPGDIVLAHFRGPDELKGSTITEMTTRMLRRIQDQGFTVARLEDYL
ncbi:polysaccharide deacetylase family protein [Streptomyces sp. NBC_00237]|uniref:polysaccharide deacetylase family protein n=1 Tax=Streptomyces sp. NBC_00237 TaxID=2975687 RepID=UPI0022548A7A|nr:polysaccharide deacetylase family protein [Streptomyces sp. NBC_00237]MCX5204777.1 polysaccharide deacetylase family protein [Streptomyces sp. NBC_00237]